MLTIQLFDQPGLSMLVYLASLAFTSVVAGGVTLIALATLRSQSLPLRHAIALWGLLVVLASPLVVVSVGASGWSMVAWKPAESVAESSASPPRASTNDFPLVVEPQTASPSDAANDRHAPGVAAGRSVDAQAPRAEVVAASDTAVEVESARDSGTAWVAWSALVLAAVWLGGMLVEGWRVGRGSWRIRRLTNSAEEVVDERLVSLSRSAAAAVGLRRLPLLCESKLAPAPLSLGVFRPRIILPASRQTEISDEAWRALFVHEMAHIARGDLLVGWLQRVAMAIYWWNPCVRHVSETISVVREQICDDLVTLHSSNAAEYAELIVDLAARVAERDLFAPALGVSDGSANELVQRLKRILDPSRALATRLSVRARYSTGLFGLALLVSVAMTSAHRNQAIATDEPVVQAEVAAGKTQTAVAEDAAENNPRLSKRIRVVDLEGKPIEGATIKPWAIQCSQGNGPWHKKGFGASDPPVAMTDADGRATIEFPRYAIVDELVPVQGLSLNISHPDYATELYQQVPVEGPALHELFQVLLRPGAFITATAFVGDRKITADQLFAQWSVQGAQLARPDAAGRLVLPRVPAGNVLVRLSARGEQGEWLSSEVHELVLADGDRRDLRLELTPAIQVKGKLDASVPRPVKNGRVVSNIIFRAKGSSYSDVQWRTCAVVDEEGNFMLDHVPESDLQVIALCDGFLAKSGEPPAFAQEHERRASVHLRPQVFSIGTQPATIEVQMMPASSCDVYVVDELGEPVADATVSFWPNVGWWGGGSQIYCEPFISTRELLEQPERQAELWTWSSTIFDAKTDAQGKATVHRLPPQECMFAVTHDELELLVNENGYRSASIELKAEVKNEVTVSMQPKGTDLLADRFPMDTKRNRHVVAKPRPKRIVKTSVAKDEVAGVVIDEEGNPLADVAVDAFTWFPGHETTTDAEGRFRIRRIPYDEEVQIEFKKPGYSPSLFMNEKPGVADWTIVLTQGTWLEGVVRDPQGKPSPGALVRAVRKHYSQWGHAVGEVWTDTVADEQGKYRLDLEPSEYDVQCRVPELGAVRHEKITLKRKQQRTLDLDLKQGVTFRATVRDSESGEPVEGITLWNWLQPGIECTSNAAGVMILEHMMKGPFQFNVTSVDSDRFKSEVAGKYARWWSAEAMHAHERMESPEQDKFQRNLDSLTFDLQGDVLEVEIFVEPATTIAGRVVDPDGQPVEGATVAPSKTGSGNSLTGDTRYSRRTDEQGNFKLTLPASKQVEYNLVAHDGDYQEWRTWANGVSPNYRTTPGQAIEGVELQLKPSITVRGVVLEGAGAPVVGIEVRAAAVDQRDNRYYVPTTKTDAEGRYELRFVAPGEQWIQVSPFMLDASAQNSRRNRKVVAEPGATLEKIDFRIDKASP